LKVFSFVVAAGGIQETNFVTLLVDSKTERISNVRSCVMRKSEGEMTILLKNKKKQMKELKNTSNDGHES
jgi:beta-lactamase superfamily II metal-dependent hydrolase